MARMQSGADFSEFDQMTSAESIRRIKKMEEQYGLVVSNYLSTEAFDKYKQETAEVLDALIHDGLVLKSSMNNCQADITTIQSFMTPLLKSRLVRFLNFFGKWYIYGVDGNLYLNRPEYEEFRPKPWYVRLANRVHNFFETRKHAHNTTDGNTSDGESKSDSAGE